MRVLVLAMAGMLCSCSVPHVFTRFERVTKEMTWAESEGGVSLRYVEAPAHEEVVFQRGLAEHLRASGKKVVRVEFEVWGEFGRFRGYRMVTIDGVPDRAERGFSRSWGGGGGAPHPVVAGYR